MTAPVRDGTETFGGAGPALTATEAGRREAGEVSGGPSAAGRWDVDRVATAFNVSRETRDRLERYVALLAAWQARMNLIGRSTLSDVWGRHVADCLQLRDLAPPDAKIWLDLGTGAGLPGLVLAAALAERGGFHMHLVDSNGRKCAFLRAAVAELDVPATVHHSSIEALAARQDAPRADVVSARALAPLPRLMPLVAPFMWKRTVVLLPKGQDVETELTETSISSKLIVERRPSITDPRSTILRIEEAQR